MKQSLKSILTGLCAVLIFAALPASGQELIIGAGGGHKHILRVAPNGAPFKYVQDAIDSITDAASDNRYLVSVAPGTYNESVIMKEWVDVRGSGPGITFITWTGSNLASGATVRGADNSELSFITVVNTGGTYTYAKGLYNPGVSPRVHQVDVNVQANGATNAYGVHNAAAGQPSFSDLRSIVSGATDYNIAVRNYGSNTNPTLLRVICWASGGEYAYGLYNTDLAAPKGQHIQSMGSSAASRSAGIVSVVDAAPDFSEVEANAMDAGGAQAYAVFVDNAYLTLRQLEIYAMTVGGVACGLYMANSDGCKVDQAYILAASSGGSAWGVSSGSNTTHISNFSMKIGGTGTNRGMYNSGGYIRLSQGSITLEGTGSGDNYGISNLGGVILEADGVVMRVTSGTGTATAMRSVNGTSMRLTNCNFSATDYGLYNDASGSTTPTYVRADSSRITAGAAIYNRDWCLTYAGSTLLEGTLYSSGTGAGLTLYQCFDQSMSAVTYP